MNFSKRQKAKESIRDLFYKEEMKEKHIKVTILRSDKKN